MPGTYFFGHLDHVRTNTRTNEINIVSSL